MEKKIEDFLHLYFGCDCEIAVIVPGQELSWERDKLNIRWMHGCLNKLVEVKPILRPLSDMTEEEKKEIGFEAFHMLRSDLGERNLPARNLSCMWAARQTAYLLSRSFDLFNLIPEGLALDSTQQPITQ